MSSAVSVPIRNITAVDDLERAAYVFSSREVLPVLLFSFLLTGTEPTHA